MLAHRENSIEKFVNSNTYRNIIAGLLLLISVMMVYIFFSTTWFKVDTDAFNSDEERLASNMELISVIVQEEPDDNPIELSAAELAAGSSDIIPTLNLEEATEGGTQVRFVDKLLYGYLILAGLLFFGTIALMSQLGRVGPMLAFAFFLSLLVYLFPTFWHVLSVIDFQGYETLPARGPQIVVKNDLLSIMDGFHSIGSAQAIGIAFVLLTLVGWAIHSLVQNGMMRRSYYSELGQSVTEYVRSKSVMQYLLAIGTLVILIVIADWFIPQARERPSTFYQFTYDGLREGALLALIALGLVLIYKATDVINFAHGELMMLGAFIFGQLLVEYGWGLGWGLLGVALAMIAVGALIERLVLRPLIGEPIISVIMVTIGLSNIIDALVGLQWKNQPKNWIQGDLSNGFLPLVKDFLPKDTGLYKELDSGNFQFFREGTFQLSMSLKYQNVYLIVIVLLIIILLMLLFRYSKQGIAMRATADDQQAALSMGISVKRIFAIAWGIAALLAGTAGILIGDIGTGATIDIPSKGLRAFPVIILGGLDSIAGAIIGGLMIGLLEQYAIGYLDPWLAANADFLVMAVSTKEIIPYIVLIAILMVRPYGLFGQEIIERV